MAYVRPENVNTPKDCWKKSEVLLDQGESEEGRPPEKWSLAAGHWQGQAGLGIRLNGTAESPGFPALRGHDAWLVLPTEFNHLVLSLRRGAVLPAVRRKNVGGCCSVHDASVARREDSPDGLPGGALAPDTRYGRQFAPIEAPAAP